MPSVTNLLLFFYFIAAINGCMRVTPSQPGMPAGNCKTCTKEMIDTTTVTNPTDMHLMDDDEIFATDPCATRKMVCKGENAILGLNSQETAIRDGVGNPKDDMVEITLTCNADGSGWVNEGKVITQADCTSVKGCTPKCAENLVTVTVGKEIANTNYYSHEMIPTYDATCTTRTFVCKGKTPVIVVNGGFDYNVGADETDNAIVSMPLTCNAAGDAWEIMGAAVTELECTTAQPACWITNGCPNILLTKSTSFGAKDMELTVPEYDATCTTRSYTCQGSRIEGKRTGMLIKTLTATNGVATFVATCDPNIPAWVYQGEIIEEVSCWP